MFNALKNFSKKMNEIKNKLAPDEDALKDRRCRLRIVIAVEEIVKLDQPGIANESLVVQEALVKKLFNVGAK